MPQQKEKISSEEIEKINANTYKVLTFIPYTGFEELLKKRKWNQHKKLEKYDKVKELYNQDLEISKISKKCYIPPKTIKNWLGFYGEPPKYIKQYEEGLENVQEK